MSPTIEKRLLPLFVTRPMWGMLPVRVTFGLILLMHGLAHPLLALGLVEIVAGALIIPGFLSRPVGAMAMAEMIVSIFSQRITIGFQGNIQLELLLFAVATMLLFSGGGRFSIDRQIARKLLKKHPSKKWEHYCIAETPYCRQWYE